MAQYKCKRCGNIIEVENGAIVAVCDNCLLAQPINAENVSVVPENETVARKSDVSSEIQTLLKRVYLFLEDEEWEKADEYCEKILDINPEFAEAYLGKIMTEFRVRKREDLIKCEQSIKGNKYDKIMRFGDDKIKAEIKSVADAIENRIAPKTKPAEKYETAVEKDKKEILEGKTKTKKSTKKILIISVAVLLAVAVAVSGVFVYRDVIVPYSRYNPRYNKAVGLMESGKYYEAISVFSLLGEYKDSEERIEECKNSIYNLAVEAEKDSDKATAAILFGKLGDYKDAEERSFALWGEIAVRETISAGSSHTVGIRKDGTITATEYIGDQVFYMGQCDVENWTDIISLSAGSSITVGLKKDGTIVEAGSKIQMYGTDIVAISASYWCTLGLKKDGTVESWGSSPGDTNKWTDIVAISSSGGHAVGLKLNGTVVATGNNKQGQCNVEGWKDIIAISVGDYHTVGLKSDGTVVATGDNEKGQCNVEDWKDIIAISADGHHTVGLKSDGTVVAIGSNDYGQCNVEGWRDIVAISAGAYHTVGLKKDDVVVAVGDNDHGQCNADGWLHIKTP